MLAWATRPPEGSTTAPRRAPVAASCAQAAPASIKMEAAANVTATNQTATNRTAENQLTTACEPRDIGIHLQSYSSEVVPHSSPEAAQWETAFCIACGASRKL